MEALDPSGATFRRNHDVSAHICLNAASGSCSAEIMARVIGGIQFCNLEYDCEAPSMERMRVDALTRGIYSSRPFCLGMQVDPTMTYCILALFADLCATRGVTANRSVNLTTRHMARVVAQADWEGLIYPPAWDTTCVSYLSGALEEIRRETASEIRFLNATMHDV